MAVFWGVIDLPRLHRLQIKKDVCNQKINKKCIYYNMLLRRLQSYNGYTQKTQGGMTSGAGL